MVNSALAAVLWCSVGGASPQSPAIVVKQDNMPDVCQVDPRVEALVEDGGNMCAPAAASNALMWLAANGYPNLLGQNQSGQDAQATLIAELASSKFRNTDRSSGTSPRALVIGLERFFADRNYDVMVETMGWRSGTRRIGRVPQIEWMLKSTASDSNLILNIGWYTYDEETRIYQRIGGHYVTVAGYKQDGSRLTLFVHDPSARDGLEPHTLTCTLKPLHEGTKLRLQEGDTQDASGFFELHGIRVKRRADLGIIDGAIAFAPRPNGAPD